jgi:hypothetical protein
MMGARGHALCGLGLFATLVDFEKSYTAPDPIAEFDRINELLLPKSGTPLSTRCSSCLF